MLFVGVLMTNGRNVVMKVLYAILVPVVMKFSLFVIAFL